MGRKKRGRGGSLHVIKQSNSRKASTDSPKAKYSKHFDREGQKVQLYSSMIECDLPHRVPTVYTGGTRWGRERAYKIVRCYEVYDPRGRDLPYEGVITERLYHGTNTFAVSQIILQGFKLPKFGGMFGKAVYLTPDLGKAFGFTDYVNPTIFLCEAVLGRVKEFETGDSGMNLQRGLELKVDTAFGKREFTATRGGSTLFWNEYAVYDPDRIRIRYLLEYGPVEK